MFDFLYGLVVGIIIENQKFGALDAHIGLRLDKAHAVNCRCGSLVELARKILDCDVLLAFEVEAVGHAVGDYLSENAVTALLEEFLRKAEKVIDIDQSE